MTNQNETNASNTVTPAPAFDLGTFRLPSAEGKGYKGLHAEGHALSNLCYMIASGDLIIDANPDDYIDITMHGQRFSFPAKRCAEGLVHALYQINSGKIALALSVMTSGYITVSQSTFKGDIVAATDPIFIALEAAGFAKIGKFKTKKGETQKYHARIAIDMPDPIKVLRGQNCVWQGMVPDTEDSMKYVVFFTKASA